MATTINNNDHHNLRQLYRAGWTGNYEALLEGLTFRDWRLHAWNKGVRPKLARLGLSKRWSIDDEAPR